VTTRSAFTILTVTVAVAMLLVGSGSVDSAVMVAVFTIVVPSTASGPSLTLSEATVDSPAERLGAEQVIVPVAPMAGVVQLQVSPPGTVGGGVKDESIPLPGRESAKTTPDAAVALRFRIEMK